MFWTGRLLEYSDLVEYFRLESEMRDLIVLIENFNFHKDQRDKSKQYRLNISTWNAKITRVYKLYSVVYNKLSL